MGQKLRKMVMYRKGLCDFVVGATKVQGPETGQALAEYFSPMLGQEESSPDLELVLALAGRKLDHFGGVMVDTDQEYLAALALLGEGQDQSKDLGSQLKAKILSLRSTFRGLFGEESVRSVGLDFNVAQDVEGILRQSEIIQDRIRSSTFDLTSKEWLDVVLDRNALADALEPGISALRDALDLVVARRKQLDSAKVRKDQALKEFDRQFMLIARYLEASFRMVGETELADRIRPRVRQLGRDRDAGEASNESTPNDEPSSDAPAVVATQETAETQEPLETQEISSV